MKKKLRYISVHYPLRDVSEFIYPAPMNVPISPLPSGMKTKVAEAVGYGKFVFGTNPLMGYTEKYKSGTSINKND